MTPEPPVELASPVPDSGEPAPVWIGEEYRTPIYTCLITQGIISLVMMLMLDGGRSAKICAGALVAHWIAILIILVRRPREGTPADCVIIEWGFVPILVLFHVAITLLSAVATW